MNPNQPYESAYEPFSSSQESYGDMAAQKTFHSDKHTTRNAIQKERRRSRTVPNPGRIALRFVALALAGSVIGVQAHAAIEWNRTRDQMVQDPSNGFRSRAWPAETDLWPTWTNIIAGGIAAMVHISALVTLCGGLRGLRQTRIYTAAVVLTSLLSIAAWVAAAIYYKLDNARGKKHWDIWSWSCSHNRFSNPHVNFKAMCIELNYSFYALIVAGAVEIICLALFVIIQVRDRNQTYKQITPIAIPYSSVRV